MKDFNRYNLKYWGIDSNLKRAKNINKISNVFNDNMCQLNKDMIDIYNCIAEATSLKIKEFVTNDSLKASMLYSCMLYDGIFSKNGTYCYQKSLRNFCRTAGIYGSTIMDGKGVCLNETYFLNDVLKQLDYNCLPITLRMDRKDFEGKKPYRPDIDKNYGRVSFSKLLFYDIFSLMVSKKGQPNHIVELIENNDSYYLYDTTNLCAFYLDGSREVKSITGNWSAKINLSTSYRFDYINLENAKKFNNIYISKENRTTAESTIINSYDDITNLYRENRKYFYKFHMNLLPEIKAVSRIYDQWQIMFRSMIDIPSKLVSGFPKPKNNINKNNKVKK